MKRTTLLGSVAAGLLAAAAATPAWAQAATYPEGTDCSAIQNSASRMDCMSQMDNSRKNPISGNPNPTTNPTPSATTPATTTAPANRTLDVPRESPAPGATTAPTGTINSSPPSGATNGTTGTGTTTP
jgi:hypothetical protein